MKELPLDPLLPGGGWFVRGCWVFVEKKRNLCGETIRALNTDRKIKGLDFSLLETALGIFAMYSLNKKWGGWKPELDSIETIPGLIDF